MDYVMRNSGTRDFLMVNATLLELLSHQLHMQQTWAIVGREYAALGGRPAGDFCTCAAGGEGAGLLEEKLLHVRDVLSDPALARRFADASTDAGRSCSGEDGGTRVGHSDHSFMSL